MKKFLYFADSTTDAVMLPADNLTGMDVASDSASVNLTFKDDFNSTGGNTKTSITTTTDRAYEVIQALGQEIRHGKQAFITVADDVNALYLHADITGVTDSTGISL